SAAKADAPQNAAAAAPPMTNRFTFVPPIILPDLTLTRFKIVRVWKRKTCNCVGRNTPPLAVPLSREVPVPKRDCNLLEGGPQMKAHTPRISSHGCYRAPAIAPRVLRAEAVPRLAGRSIGRRSDQARTDETLQPARLGIKPRPVVEWKIYDDEAGRWQLFVDAFPCFEVSRNNQAHRDIVQARIVTDDEEHLRVVRLTDDADQPLTSSVDAFVLHHPRRRRKSRCDECPGFFRARRRRYEDRIRHETKTSDVAA